MYYARTTSDQSKFQTLQEHSRNVSYLMSVFLSKLNLIHTTHLIGYFHDFGKAKVEFQEYLKHEGNTKKGEINHSSAGALYFFNKYYDQADAVLKTLLESIIITIFTHHGSCLDCLKIDGTSDLKKRLFTENDIHYEESLKGFKEECLENFDEDNELRLALREFTSLYEKILKNKSLLKKENNEIYKLMQFEIGMFIRLLRSCLIDADRLDAASFESLEEPRIEYDNAIWKKLIKTLEDNMQKKYSNSNLSSKQIRVNKLRSEISDQCKEAAGLGKGIYQFYAPTGTGKTLSVMRYALYHALCEKDIDHIIYVSPYTTILSQNSSTIKEMLDIDDPQIILEHYAELLNSLQEEDDEYYEKYMKYIDRWDSRIILTSYVQLLNVLFNGKSRYVRRMHQLTNSILIFDEIQTLDTKHMYMFTSAMNFLVEECNCTVVLCSATQPSFDTIQYPLIKAKQMIPNYNDFFDEFKRVKINDLTYKNNYQAKDVSNLASKIIKNRDCLLIIMNTKKGSADVYRQIVSDIKESKIDVEVYLINNNFYPIHKKNILNNVFERLKQHNKKIILVSTNIIEAGVDVSFQAVIRALTGLDSISQAAGRCNRNNEYEIGEVFVIKTQEYLEKLEQVKIAYTSSDKLLPDLRGKSNDDYAYLISPDALKKYYKVFYRNSIHRMNYPVKSQNINLFELLSCNETGIKAERENTDSTDNRHFVLKQAFKTAGELYQPIDNDTIAVLVNHEKGIEIIAELSKDYVTKDELRKLIHEAQQYSINLYRYQAINYQKEGAIYEIGDTGMWALDSSHYSDEYGLSDYEATSIFV